jgi:hypothetical protein
MNAELKKGLSPLFKSLHILGSVDVCFTHRAGAIFEAKQGVGSDS